MVLSHSDLSSNKNQKYPTFKIEKDKEFGYWIKWSIDDTKSGPWPSINDIIVTVAANHFGNLKYSKAILSKKLVYIQKEEEKKSFNYGSLNLEGKKIEPLFVSSAKKKLHPAIGVIDNRAYIGVNLPCSVINTDKKTGLSERDEKEYPYLIFSSREKTILHKEVLKELRWKLLYKLVSFDKWSLSSINDFLNGTTVEPGELYVKIRTQWKKYIEFDNEVLYDLVTLWTIGTYFHVLFNTYPYLYVGGIKRSGKTKALTLASFTAFNSVFSTNMSTAALFRLIQMGKCVVLLDETESLKNPDRKQDFRSLLLSGYKKGAVVYRIEKTAKDKFVPEPFEVYSPKMIGNIRGLEDVLEDRCIVIIMKRGKNKQIIDSEPNGNDLVWQEIRDSLFIFFLTFWDQVQEIYHNFSVVSVVNEKCVYTENMETINARDLELWKPILSLAKFFDSCSVYTHYAETSQTTPSLYEKTYKVALKKTKEKQTENLTETGEYILVSILKKTVTVDDYYPVKKLAENMKEQFDEEQKWINTRWIGRALKRLGFTEKRRLGSGIEYRFTVDQVSDLSERLGVTYEEVGEDNEDTLCYICQEKLDLSEAIVLIDDESGKTVYNHSSCYKKEKGENQI